MSGGATRVTVFICRVTETLIHGDTLDPDDKGACVCVWLVLRFACLWCGLFQARSLVREGSTCVVGWGGNALGCRNRSKHGQHGQDASHDTPDTCAAKHKGVVGLMHRMRDASVSMASRSRGHQPALGAQHSPTPIKERYGLKRSIRSSQDGVVRPWVGALACWLCGARML